MLFKQKIRIENILGLVLLFTAVVMVGWVLTEDFIGAIARQDKENMMMDPLFFVAGETFLLVWIYRISEWFYIYEDKIEARGIFGVRKVVNFKDVKFIEEICIDTKRNGKSRVYVFNENDKVVSTFNSSLQLYNNKSSHFIIYKTKQLEEFVKNNLDIEIIEKDFREL